MGLGDDLMVTGFVEKEKKKQADAKAKIEILADEIVVSVLCLLVPLLVPLPVMVLGIFASKTRD